jgi:hypothetical protein
MEKQSAQIFPYFAAAFPQLLLAQFALLRTYVPAVCTLLLKDESSLAFLGLHSLCSPLSVSLQQSVWQEVAEV